MGLKVKELPDKAQVRSGDGAVPPHREVGGSECVALVQYEVGLGIKGERKDIRGVAKKRAREITNKDKKY